MSISIKYLYRKLARTLFGTSRIEGMSDSPLYPYVDKTWLLPPNELLRLGTVYGGWIIPANHDISAGSVCYSAGAGEDISFDCALAEHFHCRVRIIDPTPRAIQHFQNLGRAQAAGQRFPVNNSDSDYYTITPKNFGNLSLLPYGLADQDTELQFFMPMNPAYVSCSTVNLYKTEEYFTAQCYRLQSLMKQMGDTSIDILKMDIEGGEYAVIKDLVTTMLLPRLLLIEFDEAHTPLDGNAGFRIREHISMLTCVGMQCVAIEGSNATFVRAQ